jgi:hypothetical protein
MPDPTAERDAIHAAMQRLFVGQPLRSTGALTILQLATEAGVKRRVLPTSTPTSKMSSTAANKTPNGIPTGLPTSPRPRHRS